MNVNPFSYLIEKLKGKLDKHTSFVESTDINTVKAQGVYPLSQYNSNLPEIGSNKDWSTLYVSGNEDDVVSQIFVSRGNRMFFRHCVSGTWKSWNELALKSDLKHDDYTLTFDGNGVTYLDNSKYLFFVSEGDCLIAKAGSLYLRAIDTSLNPVGPKVGSVTFSAYYFS